MSDRKPELTPVQVMELRELCERATQPPHIHPTFGELLRCKECFDSQQARELLHQAIITALPAALDTIDRLREREAAERAALLTAVRILLEGKGGAACNAVREDYPELAELTCNQVRARDARVRLEMTEWFGILLANAEIECGKKHQKEFAALSARRYELAAATESA